MNLRQPAVLIPILALALQSVARAEKVCLISVDGVIGPATASYISRALDEASAQGAECLILTLDTPGGLLDSTKEIVQRFLASPVPTVVYVSPSGAHAGSAGCFITLASDIAAMAPATAIGAAHPVEISGGQLDETMKAKLENFYASYIETIAARRHRNVEWAKSSVRDSASITAEQALEQNVVEIIATDLPDLLRQLQGRELNGRTLNTASAQIIELPMSMREQVFQVVAHPQLMLLLMLIVMYGIIGELTSPGAILPGVVGLIALVLLLYLAAILPMNVAGLALITVAVALFVIDVFAPTHGVLTAGGVVAFFLGAFMLFDRSDPFLRVSFAWIIPATAVTAAFFIFVAGAGLRAQLMPIRAGGEIMVGMHTSAVTRIDQQSGKVFVEGEYWNAVSDLPVSQGQLVEIVSVQGLTLKVRPASA